MITLQFLGIEKKQVLRNLSSLLASHKVNQNSSAIIRDSLVQPGGLTPFMRVYDMNFI